MHRGYTYNAPKDGTSLSDNERMLNNYCVQTSCYNNLISNTTFTTSDCNQSLCTVAKVLTPTVPEDNGHWFFDYFLYVGGAIHLLMSLSLLISYYLIKASIFVLPDVSTYEDKYISFIPYKTLLLSIILCTEFKIYHLLERCGQEKFLQGLEENQHTLMNHSLGGDHCITP